MQPILFDSYIFVRVHTRFRFVQIYILYSLSTRKSTEKYIYSSPSFHSSIEVILFTQHSHSQNILFFLHKLRDFVTHSFALRQFPSISFFSLCKTNNMKKKTVAQRDICFCSIWSRWTWIQISRFAVVVEREWRKKLHYIQCSHYSTINTNN